ncbi:hypothetical protein DFH06DRAFT_1304039 [Mycena polygramma]|nr:hypothetical protein DFH06DRAFT_1304039 [Mycena polygramma]
MACKEIGFAYRCAKGSGRHFVPPTGSGLKTYTPHQPHGGNELKPNIVRRDLNKLYGWTVESFILKDGKHAE